jgi:predicted RNA-binding protein with PUA domain
VLVIWILAFTSSAFALSINIDPSNVKLLVKPGESKNGEILVRNTGSSKIIIKASTEDWVYAPDGSKTFMKQGSSVYSCSNWIRLDSENFELAPKEEKKVSFILTAPKNASGGHVSVIFFEGVIKQTLEIAVSGRIGVIVYQDTEGDVKRNAEIKSFDILASEEGKPVRTRISFINKGNTYIIAKPKISILKDNKVVLESKALPINTLPGDEVTNEILIKDNLKTGNYKAQVELTFDDKTLKSQSDFTIKK